MTSKHHSKEHRQKKEALVTQEVLRHHLFWDDASNVFRWLRPMSNRVSIGSVAGGIHKPTGYRVIGINNVTYREHRLIWLWYYNEWPVDEIDHINGNKLDNRIDNLRAATRQKNAKNQKLRSDNKSGVPGVFFNKQRQKWHAYIKADGKRKHLGYFDKFEDAVAARKAAEIEFGYHPNHGRAA